MKLDQIHKLLQKGHDEITRRLVHEVTVGVEFLVSACDENLGLKKAYVFVNTNVCRRYLYSGESCRRSR